ncbi:MAG: hypothetical protein HC905_25100 [Bacteroidales bacterium]|nr:hypothetical protein [Bacteroidales bacterium]
MGPDFEYLLTPIISTIAGNGNKNNKDGTALEAEFNAPNSIATDSLGNIYVVAQSKIRMITKAGMVTTIYDNNVFPYFSVSGICIDEDDNLFASGSRYIFKVNKNSTLTIIGNGDNTVSKYGYISFDCIFFGPNHTIYSLDNYSNRIFSCTLTGEIELIAGNSEAGYKNGDALSALFNDPRNLTVDNMGNIFLTDLKISVFEKYLQMGSFQP